MKLKLKNPSVLCLLFLLCFCFAAQTSAQKSIDALKPTDRREIIKLLLETVSKNNPDKTIYVSTRNLSPVVQSDISEAANEKVQIVSPEDKAGQARCDYQFGAFTVSNKLVSISFGNCKAGLAYNFKKVRGKWKAVPYVTDK